MQIGTISPTISPALPQGAPAAPATDPVDPAVTPASEPATPAVPTEPPSKFLQKLASGHFNAVADLRHRLRLADEIRAADLKLPEPAAPRGNGKAYAKFLGAYKASQPSAPPSPAPAPSAAQDPVPQTGPVDLAA